ncbi:ABC transporter ATP-binding protein [Ktedonosporobacter rubrisoli]|uniref:ABC transporter ATP-binding protein n=1 Tax=Ktedonosporobacter rubrisoli TaxID=2509675 RepID=A0A4P6JW27_KTERU|nr:ABC transporter ATP-binding protein [Ktedonosporobacter rubrisoli]QBD79186.1 ABC transporter ATP-binding protein [Ktedonosporobacter rubrisoli]
MKPSPKRYMELFAHYLKPQWRRTLLMTLSLLGGIGLQLLKPQILRYFIDTAIARGATIYLLAAGLLFVIVALLNQGITTSSAYLSQSVAWTATNHLRHDLVAHCLSLDLAFHKAHTIGELIERIDGDVDMLSNFFSQLVVNLLSNVVLMLGILILFFTIDWRAGLVLSLFTAVALLILSQMQRRIIPLFVKLRQMSAEFYGFLSERLTGTEDLRANGAVGYTMQRFYALLRQWWQITRKADLTSIAMGNTSLIIFVFGCVLTVLSGTYLWSRGLATIGTIYLMFSYTNLLSGPVNQIQRQLQDLQQAQASLQRIQELLSTTSSLTAEADRQLPPGALSVAFEHVSFGYEPELPVIRDISLAIQPQKVLGVLGRTGSGKTTLARLLFRLYDVQEGQICLSAVPIQMTRLHELRRRIGMVTQDVQLFRASVRDNLTFFNHAIPDSRIIAALEEVGLASWLQTLPDGLASQLGPEGEGLSAGEAQLLAFARVFLSEPDLVILDEASSRLDPSTERAIERAIDKLFTGRTAIVIAHRLSTIKRADAIAIIEDGHVLEYGNRLELAGDPASRFAHLLTTGLEEALA